MLVTLAATHESRHDRALPLEIRLSEQRGTPVSSFFLHNSLHIRLLDTKQIWKAGRQKRIVSCTFFPPSCLPKSLFFAACQATG